MKASETQLRRFIQTPNTQFVIPVYQRNYDWQEKQCKELLDDIKEVGASTENVMHFIGSIVCVCNDEYTTEEVEKLVIIDGQQRLTTVTLLLIAMYHFYKSTGNEKAEQIKEDYIINKNAREEGIKIKLKATAKNAEELEKLIEKEYKKSGDEFSNVLSNYWFFRNNINEENVDVVYEGFKRLLFVEIRLERNKDDAQKIFESLNSTGLNLTEADLIRNYVLMELDPKEQERLYVNYWNEIESNTRIGMKSYMSDFVRDYLIMLHHEIVNKKDVYSSFKSRFRQETMNAEEVLRELLRFSEIYKNLINPKTCTDKDIAEELEYIRYMEINVSYPFLLPLIRDYEEKVIDKATLINILQFVQTYACRRFVMDLPTNTLNKIFMVLYRQVNKDDYEKSIYKYILTRLGKSRMPTDYEIEKQLPTKDFYLSKSQMRLYILEKIENYNNKEKIPIIGNGDITIEHIFPQNPDSKWRRDLSEGDYTEFKTLYTHTIGNLTLSGNNGNLSNKSFQEKKELNVDGKEQGYRYSRMWLNRDLGTIDKWNVENYKIRSKKIVKRFCEVWKIPQGIELKESQLQNIFDIETASNKKIDYAEFFDERIEVKTGIALYNHVIKALYNLAPENFVEKYREKLLISENMEDFRICEKLNSSYYYNTNMSYNTIIKNMKAVLRDMNLFDVLYIKFRD